MVYTKRPFGGPLQVFEYLGRYTHKIAISNHRINAVEKDTVRFAYRDYRQSGKCKEMTLAALEFIRRFALHILPKRFVRIRHYGILSSKVKGEVIPIIRTQLNPWLPEESVDREATAAVAAIAMPTCPRCKEGVMQYLMDFDHRGPPAKYLKMNIKPEKNASLQQTM